MAEVFEQYGPYKRVRRLGIGGMAETFLAVQRGAAGFEQRVCMKFILPGYRGNADFKRLFLREASIAASLRHSNIVGVIDVDASVGYMVLELVDGVDLRTLVNACPNRKLAPELATLVTIEMCKALAYAHGRVRRGQADGIVHRDVSPSNVLISYAGEVKLTDFGVARAMRADVEPLSTTVKGKLCYMSPEQARGQLLDGRSDLFSLGVVFYELLCGKRPFDGSSDAETLLRVTSGQHTPLLDVAPEVPRGLALIVERMIHRDREQRYASADSCIDALVPFTPRVTAFRQLGELAKAARPHETLAGVDIQELDASDAIRALDANPSGARDASVRNQGLGSTLLQTQALPGNTLPPRAAPPPLVEHEHAAPITHSQTTLPSVHRNAWIALGVSFSLLLVVGFAWVSKLTQRQSTPSDPIGLDVAKTTREAAPADSPRDVAAQPPAVARPAGATLPTLPLTDSGGLQIIAPPTDTARAPTAPQAPAEPPQQDSARQRPQRSAQTPKPDATLDIGVVPWGQVWIDNRLLGWAPQQGIKLHPGRHVIGAGDASRPQVKRTINLRPGEQAKLTLQLDSSGTGDDATGSASDR